MKKMILSTLVLLSASASMATTQNLHCTVPSDKVAVKMEIELSAEASVDYVTMNLVDAKSTSVFYSQMEKGQIADQLKNGFLQLLAMTDSTAQGTDGVIVNAGFLALGKEADGSFSGFLSAQGNIYPLACKF
jgi:hypothetical protein